ncbi:MAG: NAD(P)/FAD-dependent oxidoreductase [Hyphomicrobiaceae bacterium]|nr:NAD(P)/FAD-dependent oxidoreductase [Hyphomicrobiaceae bacterium]
MNEQLRRIDAARPEAKAGNAAGQPATPEHFDVLIVGAGISGIGSAYHLLTQCPGTSFVILETQAGFGGTWRTHRYPGIRSDSDLYTFGYRFKPWTGPPIATAEEILAYMGEVIEDNGIAPHIRYRHRISRAAWSSAERRWTITATDLDAGEERTFTAGFLWMCQGYYRHEEGYTPQWPGMGDFKGRIVHPQTWPEDLDLADKRVVVIGSGATAATLVPAIAGKCRHVTMLQRSPTFFRTGRNAIEIADELRRLEVDETWIHEIVRRKILYEQWVFTHRCVDEPEVVTKELLSAVKHYLGEDFDIAKHFTPSYRPWRQRIAFIPDGDLFQGIKQGKASVVTDEIERFTADGIMLKSGQLLEADVIVTATGFNLSALGDMAFAIDGAPLVWSDTVTYRGLMFTGVPNMAWVFGYFRASWTLRTDMVADLVCRLLNHMKDKGVTKVVPQLRPQDSNMPILPWIDAENFNPGYLLRGMHLWPKRGDKPEWQHSQDYWTEKNQVPCADLEDGCLVYEA